MNMRKFSHKRLSCICVPIQLWSVLRAIKQSQARLARLLRSTLSQLAQPPTACGFFRLFVRAVHLEINVDSVPIIGI